MIIYKSGLFQEIVNSINIAIDEINELDVKMYFLSIMNISDILNSDVKLSLSLQKLFFDIILYRNDLTIKGKPEIIETIFSNALWGLSNISGCEDLTFFNNFIKFDIIAFLINSKIKKYSFLYPSIKIIGNLLANSTELTDKILTSEMITFLIENICYSSNDNSIKSLSLWAMSNIFDSQAHMKYAIDFNLIDIYEDIFHLNLSNQGRIDKEISYQLGRFVEISSEETKMILIKRYNICNFLKKIIEKYSNQLEHYFNTYMCHLTLISVLKLLELETESALLARKIFNSNGMMDLIDRIIVLSSNVKDLDINESFKNTIQSLLDIGDYTIEKFQIINS